MDQPQRMTAWQCPWCFYIADDRKSVIHHMKGCEAKPKKVWK